LPRIKHRLTELTAVFSKEVFKKLENLQLTWQSTPSEIDKRGDYECENVLEMFEGGALKEVILVLDQRCQIWEISESRLWRFNEEAAQDGQSSSGDHPKVTGLNIIYQEGAFYTTTIGYPVRSRESIFDLEGILSAKDSVKNKTKMDEIKAKERRRHAYLAEMRYLEMTAR
jgi:hypothetical protein